MRARVCDKQQVSCRHVGRGSSTPEHLPTWRDLVPVLGEEGIHVLATGLQ